ncbi:hypothetical protein AWL63_15405 [Sphingomonas panacis]|uniref:Uncharacterized protein n=1 Tax=Sphingomonas panacis TaxID=1560345 RepID=A0A1B3ZCJ2_9SPHN|nr:hypothetical protein [Sphingomonas panacis]AOH85137.1 hypothetical protein AWL63_15405 [Sphingomonas panacis]
MRLRRAQRTVHGHRRPNVIYSEQLQPITNITYRLGDGKPVETKRIDAPAFAECDLYAAAPLERQIALLGSHLRYYP